MAIEGLQCLLVAVRQGLHAVSGPFEIFSALSSNASLSARERATALGLANRRTELPLLERLVNRKIYVSEVVGMHPRRVLGESWEVGVGLLGDALVAAPTVLAENLIDAELYCVAAHHYRVSRRISGVTSKYLPRGGGGSQIDVEFRQLLGNNFPVLALTDGDLKHPAGERSAVSKRCDLALQNEEGIGWHVSLPVQEIENLVPHSVLLEVSDPGLRTLAHESLKNLNTAGEALGEMPCHFTCMKSGKTLAEVFNATDIKEKSYWLTVASELQKTTNKFVAQCMDEETCGNDPCVCVVSSGFGADVLQQVRAWLNNRSHHEALKAFSKSSEWMSVGESVFESCIAFQPAQV